MIYYLYVLYSLKDGKLYKGSTSQLLKRIEQHHAGQTKSTQKRRPLILLYYEAIEVKKEAIRREKWSKSLEGGKALPDLLKEKSLLSEKGKINDQQDGMGREVRSIKVKRNKRLQFCNTLKKNDKVLQMYMVLLHRLGGLSSSVP